MADEDRGRPAELPHVSGCGEEVRDVRGEAGIGELSVAATEAGEVEAQRGDALARECGGEAACRVYVFAAGEAVGEERVRPRRAVRQVEPRGQLVAGAAREVEAFGAHQAYSLPHVMSGPGRPSGQDRGASCFLAVCRSTMLALLR
jgi:hypothetical protein